MTTQSAADPSERADVAPLRAARFTRHAGALALEVFSVVLGIVLGFAVNAWHERRAEADEARQALVSIRAEIVANRAALGQKLPYHRAMRDSLAALVARTHTAEVAGGQLAIGNWNGLQPARLLEDAWQTARSTDALRDLPFSVVLGLSRTYAVQQRIADVNRAFFGTVYTPAFAAGEVGALGAMRTYLDDVAATERDLITAYDGELRELDAVIAARYDATRGARR